MGFGSMALAQMQTFDFGFQNINRYGVWKNNIVCIMCNSCHFNCRALSFLCVFGGIPTILLTSCGFLEADLRIEKIMSSLTNMAKK